MYVARLADGYIVKRMPDTGDQHATACPSYEPPADLSGLGQLLGTAINEDPATGETALKLSFSMTKIGSRSTVPTPGSPGDSVRSDGTKLSLRGLLHYLWDKAQLTRWQPSFTGHLAYRSIISADCLPRELRSNSVQVWLGARMHVVSYPVRCGGWINVVAVVHGRLGEGHGGNNPRRWTADAHVNDLLAAIGPLAANLRALTDAAPAWTLWPLHDRPVLSGPSEHARGSVALLGDAAHPLRPYLAQGAGMAMEDAWILGKLVERQHTKLNWVVLFEHYAADRWARNARVQRHSQKNGRLYHAQGLLRLGRNAGLKIFGKRLLANRWLYNGPPRPVAIP